MSVATEAEMRTRTVSLACLIASLMGAQLACAQALTLTRSAESGVDTRISHERAWDRNCNALSVTVSITKNPVNGTVAVVPGVTSTLPRRIQVPKETPEPFPACSALAALSSRA
jgi:hypothetical protein